ncbi:tRNA methyltransferase subunit GCD14 [Aspergillus luchuensis]|uniref:tRNA methyltransferase subunit GCD14 n=1 Tax=Aspergillus kawachii TaxID=1069201 RepID=A0A146F241_ASPKA|nr:tRNA methyltransferase subunit GCD14 [Aspergillus luchuensis]
MGGGIWRGKQSTLRQKMDCAGVSMLHWILPMSGAEVGVRRVSVGTRSIPGNAKQEQELKNEASVQ